MDILASVCLLALLCSVLADFYVSNDTTGWMLANRKCKLATPELHFTSDKITVNVNMDIGGEVWVGYYQASTQFEYIGCAAKRDIGAKISTKSDPGQCLSACNGHSVIGIYDKECYCLNDDFIESQGSGQTMFNTCTKKCGEDSVNKIVCGGRNGEGKYISIYRSIGFDASSLNKTKYCKAYENKRLTWYDCKDDFRFFCEKGHNIWIESPNTVTNYSNWLKATTLCFTNGSRPSTHNKALGFPIGISVSQTWTGIVRSNAIYKIGGSKDDHLHANAFGFIKLTKGKLEFETTDDQNKQLKRLCVKTTTPSPDIESSTTTPKKTTATTETSETKSTYEPAKSNQQNDSSNVGAIVGATLTIVILIVIAIAAVIYVRKWGVTLPPFLKKEKREPPPSNANNNNAYVISRPVEILQSSYKTDTDNYAEIDLTTTSYNEDNKGGAAGKAQEGDDDEEASPYSHDYFVLEKVDEGEYDTTKDADQTKIPNPNPNTFNPYNKLNFEQSSNYDHIGTSKGGNAKIHVSDSENTYNTTDTGYLKKSIGKTDNDYDTADGTDTYNHTNIQGHQKGLGKSENDYDAI